MKLASWNVNSIRVRGERLLRWLEAHQPDVVCLQELKATEAQFPFEARPGRRLRRAGARPEDLQRRGHPGPRGHRLEDVRAGLDDGADDPRAGSSPRAWAARGS